MRILEHLKPLALLWLRVALGIIYFYQGYQKLFGAPAAALAAEVRERHGEGYGGAARDAEPRADARRAGALHGHRGEGLHEFAAHQQRARGHRGKQIEVEI